MPKVPITRSCTLPGSRGGFLAGVALLCMSLPGSGIAGEPPVAAASHIDAGRLQANLAHLSEIGRGPAAGNTRLVVAPAELDAHCETVGFMKGAGPAVRIDAAGNVFGRREG